MKKTALLLLVIMFFGVSGCRNSSSDITSVQPGHFCQVGGIAVSGDTVFIAGSYVPEDNPNFSTQPVYGYIAALNAKGKTLWEKKANEPDYIRWMHVDMHKAGYLATLGYQDSPLSGRGMKLRQVNTASGKTNTENKPISSEIRQPLGVAQLETYKFLTLYSVEDSHVSSLKTQTSTLKAPINGHTLLTGASFINSAGILPDGSIYAATGSPLETTALWVSYSEDSLRPITLPMGFGAHLINEVVSDGPNYLAATTIKNGQGPCFWQLSPNDSIHQHTCLNYWPYHGNVKILAHNNCTVTVFNASDATNEHNAHLVVLDGNLQLVWEQRVDTDYPFIIKDLAANGNNIYIAGTLEMGENGSAMAIKILELPNHLGCNQTLLHQ